MNPSDLIKRLEGCRLTSYPDPATGGAPWTVGYGHTSHVVRGLTITQHQAEVILESDISWASTMVDALVRVPITSSQRAALVSFVFNEGPTRLIDPACRILPLLNAGDHLSAAGQFMHWTMAVGKRILVNRRMAEIEAFLSELEVL